MGKKSKDVNRMTRKRYEKELDRLHAELVRLQEWIKAKGLKIIVVFEGRDAAGKGGVIKALTERVSPRVFRVVALPAPTDQEKSQMYIQRYMQHFPSAGEMVIFDRSWYNRAGVERVMNFCTREQYIRFLQYTPMLERAIVDSGIQLFKYWMDVSMDVQEQRFQDRIEDPRKIWKLSPMDIESFQRWYDYSRARDDMMDATDLDFAPWTVVQSDEKRRARLNCISDLLSRIDYEDVTGEKIDLGKRHKKDAYDDKATLANRRTVTARF